jgi:hypothetical protein
MELDIPSGGCDNCAPHKIAVNEFVCRASRENGMGLTKSVPTEWSRRRTRYDPPGLEEAITAAQGLTDEIKSQIEIAAQLIGLPEDEIRPQVLAMQARPTHNIAIPVQGRRSRTVLVERRGARMAR